MIVGGFLLCSVGEAEIIETTRDGNYSVDAPVRYFTRKQREVVVVLSVFFFVY